MKWYYEVRGGHTHVRVVMNGAKCGDLCFRNDQFRLIRAACQWIEFINKGEPSGLTYYQWKKEGKR